MDDTRKELLRSWLTKASPNQKLCKMGMEEKSSEFAEKGSELYAKA